MMKKVAFETYTDKLPKEHQVTLMAFLSIQKAWDLLWLKDAKLAPDQFLKIIHRVFEAAVEKSY